jgi:fucose permease
LGSLKLSLSRSFNIGEGRFGALLWVQNLAVLPMMIVSGLWIDTWGVRPVLIFGSFATALCLFALSSRPGVPQAFTAVILCGFGSAGLCTGSIMLMPEAFFPDHRSASLNVGMVFFALGALVTPALTDVLLRIVGYRRTMAILALPCLVPGLLAAVTKTEELRSAGTGTPDFVSLLSNNSLLLAGLVFALYAPLEASISSWATTYLTDRGHGERRAVWLLSGFWGAFLLSRLAVGALMNAGYLRPGSEAWVLVIPSLLAAVVLGNMAGTVGTASAGRALLLVGFFLGPIFPTLVGMVFKQLGSESHMEGTAFGLLFAAGSLGSLVLLPVVNRSTGKSSPQVALRVPMFGALLLTAVALVFSLMT